MVPPFDGTIFQNGFSLTVHDDGILATAGRFDGLGADVTVNGTFLVGSGSSFNSTGGILSVHGDTTLGAGFLHNGGTLAVCGGASLTADASLFRMDVLSDATWPYATINGPVYLLGDLSLTSGMLRRGAPTDSSVHARRDVTVGAGFGAFDARNDCPIMLDGTVKQNIHNAGGGIIPSLVVDKDSTLDVACWGASPLMVNEDFVLLDSTFDTHGLNLQVGI